MSPYLFIIAAEGISILLQQMVLNGKFSCINQSRECKISHHAFVDDLLLIAKGDKKTLTCLLDIFQIINLNSGLDINRDKSKLYIAKPKQEIIQWCRNLNISIGLLPVKYLGISLFNKKLSKALYQPLIDNIQNRIDKWTTRLLSFAGRLKLINFVLQSLTVYWISSLPLPLIVANTTDKMFRNFLWTRNTRNKGFCTIKWEETCLPKAKGGLGIRSLADINQEFMLK